DALPIWLWSRSSSCAPRVRGGLVLGDGEVVAVVAQEEVLEGGRRDGQVGGSHGGQRGQHVVDGRVIDVETQPALAGLEVVDTVHRLQVRGIGVGARGDRGAGEVAQLGEGATLHVASGTDDGDGVAQLLDLGQDV